MKYTQDITGTFCAQPRLHAIALSVALACGSGPALALSIGLPDVHTSLGQPLQMLVPVKIDDPGEASPQCLRLIPTHYADGVPTLTHGKLTLERLSDGTSALRVTTWQPVFEPILRVIVEAGCQRRMQREFTLLLDPPPGTDTMHAAAPAGGQRAVAAPPALRFGTPQIRANRGQPLWMKIPVSGPGAHALAAACVHTLAGEGNPRVLSDARVFITRQGGSVFLHVNSPDPLTDDAVRVIVEAGCEAPQRHEVTVLVDLPALAAVEEAAVAIAPRPASSVATPKREAPRKSARTKPAAAAEKPAAAPEQPAAALEQSGTTPGVAPQAPPRSDRLVLSSPDDTTPAPMAPPDDAATREAAEIAREREAEILRRVDDLASEVRRLRSELDAANTRNRELTAKAKSNGYAWTAGGVGMVLLAAGLLLGWRHGRPKVRRWEEDESAGPMTCIMGCEERADVAQGTGPAMATPAMPARAPSAAPVASTKPAVPVAIASPAKTAPAPAPMHEDHRAAPNSGDPAIQVTEFRDTSQVIDELYSPFLEGGRPTMLAPQTKTEIAVDIDVGTRPAPNADALATNTNVATELAVDIDVSTRPAPNADALATNTNVATELAVDINLDEKIARGRSESLADDDATVPTDHGRPAYVSAKTAAPTQPLDLDLSLDLDRLIAASALPPETTTKE